MTLPAPTSSEPARSRRALLAAAAGGLVATAASALGGPARTLAAHLPGFGHPNNAGSANTTLATNSTGTALLVQQNGTGTALRGQADEGIAGFFTSFNGSGVSGVVAANNKYGVYGGNDALTYGGGAAIRADGKQNHGVVATTANEFAAAVRGINSGVGDMGSRVGVYGEGGGSGVRGTSTSGTGVLGTSDTSYGVYGQSDDGTGVRGVGTQAGAIGVSGHSNDHIGVSGFGEVAGVRGEASAGDGVVGIADTTGKSGLYASNSANDGYGVYGDATGTTGTGVFGNGPSSGNYAGYFLGNVQVTGTLVKGGGAFKIDHPLDPANRYLYHSFVESPDMLNVYSGNVTTDAKGQAVVTLPTWFEALNRDYRYQLTVIGGFAQAAVAEEITDRRFAIRTDKPNVKVSWQVTGVRHDPYAEAHRIPVDERKPANERGTYLHPLEHGQPGSKGLDARHQRPRPEPLPAPASPPHLTP